MESTAILGSELPGAGGAMPLPREWPDKYCPPDRLRQVLICLPRPLVMTNGVFDVLHRGHVQYLQEARQLGASLIVALNSDASVRRLHKGPGRPLNPEIDRAWVLAALEAVSLVVSFEDTTPLALLEHIRPDTYVKGGDYDMSKLAETPLVASWGGRSVALSYRQGYATTALMERIRLIHSQT